MSIIISKLKIGDVIYDTQTGRSLGVVSRKYRMWGQTHYEYETKPGTFDNTSRHAFTDIIFGALSDVRDERAPAVTFFLGKSEHPCKAGWPLK